MRNCGLLELYMIAYYVVHSKFKVGFICTNRDLIKFFVPEVISRNFYQLNRPT